MTKAIVNKIIYNTFIDGPGSRMAIFLQGCNMKCLYCHNPETQNYCNACAKCVKTCPVRALDKIDGKIKYNIDICTSCDTCTNNCPNYSSPKCTELSVEELYLIVAKYSDFIDGITISGGECTIQYKFIIELFTMIKENTNLTTFVDTNGYVDYHIFSMLCKVTDGFMIDLKVIDKSKHIQLTGLDNSIILDNIELASRFGILYEVRTVIVEGYTNHKTCITEISELIKKLNNYTFYKLIPFRPLGVRSYLVDYPNLDTIAYNNLCCVADKILGNRVKTVT